ncbi:hypothetical protein [Algihabitans albus]|uniref:hypothetical protein n=1 Tax=Algihabitans albus TaxID=2164067 RepID=UPI000E5C8AC4|nr:hypothetical protein [Algihabitans albus]
MKFDLNRPAVTIHQNREIGMVARVLDSDGSDLAVCTGTGCWARAEYIALALQFDALCTARGSNGKEALEELTTALIEALGNIDLKRQA